jgi:hypothetical protein
MERAVLDRASRRPRRRPYIGAECADRYMSGDRFQIALSPIPSTRSCCVGFASDEEEALCSRVFFEGFEAGTTRSGLA